MLIRNELALGQKNNYCKVIITISNCKITLFRSSYQLCPKNNRVQSLSPLVRAIIITATNSLI